MSTENTNFTGGSFVFRDEKHEEVTTTVEPKLGMILMLLSNLITQVVCHASPQAMNIRIACCRSTNVEVLGLLIIKVINGTRYALTLGFTCDPKKKISDPQLK